MENASSEVDIDESRLSGGGGGIVVGPLFTAGERDSKLRGLLNAGAAAVPPNDGVTRRGVWSSESGVRDTSAPPPPPRRKSTASGGRIAEDEVSGGGVVAGVPPGAYSCFSDDGGDWKQVPATAGADVAAGLRRLPPLPTPTPLVMGTRSGGRDDRKRSPATTGTDCDSIDPASWNTDSGGGGGGGCDGTATPTCRC